MRKYHIAVFTGESYSPLLRGIAAELNGDACFCFFDSKEELIRAVQKNIDFFNVIILAIETGKMTGINIAQLLRVKGCKAEFIFISDHFNYSIYFNYAIEGCLVNAYAFLLKTHPKKVYVNVLKKAIERVKRDEENYYLISEKNSVKKVNINDILYFETSKNGIIMHTSSGSKVIRSTLTLVYNDLSSKGFIYCHKGIIVNIRFIVEICGGLVILDNGIRLPLSRRRQAEVKDAFISYVKES